MRIFTASLATESNSFSPIPTSRETFEQTLYFKPGEHPDRGTLCTGPLYVARRRAKQEGFELIEGSCFWAEPSAPRTRFSVRWQCGSCSTPITAFGPTIARTRSIRSPSQSS